MQRVTKIVAAVASTCMLAVLGDALVYQFAIVHPVDAEVRNVLAQSDPEDRDPPPPIRRAVLAEFGNDASRIRIQVARDLELRLSAGRLRNLDREMHEMLVAFACKRYTVEQLTGTRVALAYDGVDHGMNRFSLRLFEKPLHELSDDEAAKVVAYYWGPSYMAKYPDIWQARSNRIRTTMDADMHVPVAR